MRRWPRTQIILPQWASLPANLSRSIRCLNHVKRVPIFSADNLREKWPVGSKAKFKILADRVGADHTYLAVPCGAVKIDALDDAASLKEAETQQLAATLPFIKPIANALPIAVRCKA